MKSQSSMFHRAVKSHFDFGRPRYGMAPLEVVMALPVLLLMVGMLFYLASAAITRTDTSTQVQNLTFAGRYPELSNRATQRRRLEIDPLNAMKRILGQDAQACACDRLSVEEKSVSASPVLQVFADRPQVAHHAGEVLTDPWDYRAIPFPNHPRLTLSPRFTALGLSGGDLNAFADLGRWTDAKPTHDGDLTTEDTIRRRAHQTVKEALNEAKNLELSTDDEGDVDRIRNTIKKEQQAWEEPKKEPAEES